MAVVSAAKLDLRQNSALRRLIVAWAWTGHNLSDTENFCPTVMVVEEGMKGWSD